MTVEIETMKKFFLGTVGLVLGRPLPPRLLIWLRIPRLPYQLYT